MNYYLSSYKLGNKEEVDKLKKLIPANKKTAYISNALDFSDDIKRRRQSEKGDIDDLKTLDLKVEFFDLRNYFNNIEKLESDLRQYGVIWIRGGNVFVLRQAMSLCGFDIVLKKLVSEDNELLYGGYSAGACVLAPSLKGLELVDDATNFPYKQQRKIIWQGLNLIDFTIVPHYKSDHPESKLVEKVIEHHEDNKINYRTLSDGQVIIIKNN